MNALAFSIPMNVYDDRVYIGAYDQSLMDALVGLDSTHVMNTDTEFVVYLASVGKVL